MVDSARLCAEFARLAAISSPSLREGAIARVLVERLRALGAEVLDDGAAARTGGEVGNLIARFPGSGNETEPLLFSVHMDTVEPCANVEPLLRDGVFTSAGATILGADDKAGIAELLEALTVVQEQKLPHPPLEVVVTIAEEIGLCGAKALDYSLLRAKRGIALDTSGVDLVINRAPCAHKLRFTVTGREAHAGIAPEKGISAIEIAAAAINGMRLGRIDAETTANIGTIAGGQASNIVAREVVVEAEARSHDPEKLAAQTRHMVACFEQAATARSCVVDGVTVGASVAAEITDDYPRMAVAAEAPIVRRIGAAAVRLGRSIEVRGAGGGSDANIFNGHGIETVILGTGMSNVHTVDEYVRVADMVQVAELLIEIIREA